LIRIVATDNYQGNLDSIETYWEACLFPAGNGRLLTELAATALVHLPNHPRMGRNFLQRQPGSVDAATRAQKIDALLRTLNTDTARAEVREYVMTDYLLLYALVGEVIYLLAIKHHKQLSFDIDL
jgi:ParE toxin of type II toxin-antitoxin system, parDE